MTDSKEHVANNIESPKIVQSEIRKATSNKSEPESKKEEK